VLVPAYCRGVACDLRHEGSHWAAWAMTVNIYTATAFAYLLSILGGWAITGVCVYYMRKTIGKPRPFFRWLDLWLGSAERIVATTLILFQPRYLAPFIGGWVALKFAANWRPPVDKDEPISQVSLVGSVVSFAVAIGATIWMRPDVIAKLI
jgi:hypothetical protein